MSFSVNEWYVAIIWKAVLFFSFRVHIYVTYHLCYFVCVFRSLSFLVKLEQLDLGSNELELLVSEQLILLKHIIYSR